MAQRGVVKGRVVNVRNNEPLIGAIVRLENQAAATVTDSVGNYVIKQVKPGLYHITVSLLGYEKKRSEELQVMGNQTTFVDVAMNESEVSLTEPSSDRAPRKPAPRVRSLCKLSKCDRSKRVLV